jgi:hypothetical protein
MTSAAHTVAFERVSAGFGACESRDREPFAPLRYQHVRANADDAEAVQRILASKPEFDFLAFRNPDFRWPELEPFRCDFDDARGLSLRRRGARNAGDEKRKERGQ